MNKSKFLKKSLAAVLAVLMIAAMIPLSAAAASTGYKPTGLKITGPNGEVATGSGNSYTLNLNWDKNDPKIVISTETADDDIYAIKSKVDASGNQVGDESTAVTGNPTTDDIFLEMDDDGNPIPFRFFVKNGSEQSDDITVTWTKASASTSGKAASAKLAGKFDGEINDSAKTITFTVPFGYNMAATGANAYVINFEGCADASLSGNYTATNVGTNMKKPVPAKVSTETQDGKTTVQYDVIVKEETGLTEFKVGDLRTEIEIATADNTTSVAGGSTTCDKGMETGYIKVYVPSTLEPVDSKVKLIPTFAISDPNTSVTIQNGANAATDKATAESGKEFDFSYAYCGQVSGSAVATSQLKTGVDLVLTSTGGAKRTYKLVFVRNEDVELTSVKAEPGTGNTGTWGVVDGDINGSDIEVVVPKGADLSKIKLTFTGPRGFDSAASVSIGNITDTFDENGAQDAAASKFVATNCTSPLAVVVKSDDGKHQKVYTLTIKPIEEDSVAPAITSGVLVLNKGTSDEATYTASISGTTITFTVPHSTKDSVIAAGDYTWARNSKATTLYFGTAMPDGTTTAKPTKIANGGSVGIVSASGNAVKYEIKFARATAETGKSISNMKLTEADNTHLIGYNNNKTYNVTISNGKFTVTMPTTEKSKNYYVDFELSKGAKLFAYNTSTGDVTPTPIANADDDGANMTQLQTGAANTGYFVADEMLATMIANKDKLICTAGGTNINYPIINREYGSHKVDYVFDVKEAASDDTRLPDFTDTTGNVKGTVSGLKGSRKITLEVPASFAYNSLNANSRKIYLDFKMPNNATLAAHTDTTLGGASIVTGVFNPSGLMEYVDGELNHATASAWTKDAHLYITKEADGSYVARVGDHNGSAILKNGAIGAAYVLRVTAENGDTENYTIDKIKVNDPEKGAQITSLTVNGVNASINDTNKTITANVPYGTNLGQVKIALTASKMALVTTPNVNTTTYPNGVYDTEVAGTYDLRYPIKIKVMSESTTPRVTNTYTLTVKTGEQFSDVPANAWFAPYVKEAVEKDIVQGLGDGTFGPYKNITREDFAVMTGRMLGIKVDENATVPFKDASSVSGYAKGYVAYFAEEGIIGGYEDSTFKPKNNITREEAAKILAVALDLEVTGTPTFADTNKISGWARPYVAAVQTAKVFNGDEANRFNGTTRITRAETAKVMVDSLKIK
jgi:hypothetical protein